MPEIKVNPVVADVSPSMYDALKNSGATPQEVSLIEQISYAQKKGMELRRLDKGVAKNEFTKLNPAAQTQIKALFPNDPYLQPDPSILARLGKGIVSVASVPLSPLIGMFRTMGQYGKAINTPLRVGFQATVQDKSIFSKKVWDDAYQGKDLYNQNDIDKLNKKYGEANVHVAMGLTAGKQPGEILSTYKDGTPDPEILNALSDSLNNKDFSIIMDDVKLARFSPGRSEVRAEYDYKQSHPQQSSIWHYAKKILLGEDGPNIVRTQGLSDEQWKKQYDAAWRTYAKRRSGAIDAIYQLGIDPLTYVTGGGTKAGTVGERITKNVQEAIKLGGPEAGAAEAFKMPQVRDLWDNTAGPLIDKYTSATNQAEKGLALRDIKRNLPGYDDIEIIRSMSRYGVKDAATAEKYFAEVDNTHKLISGGIAGTNFYRNGVATARNQRQLTQGRLAFLEAMFNPVTGVSSPRKTVEELQAQSKNAWEILAKTGEQIDQGVNPAITKLLDIDQDISKTQKLAFKLGTLAARNPGKGAILYGNDAYKTIETFRNRARILLPRDMADTVTQFFLEAPVDQQIAAIRNIYAATMQKNGLEGAPHGREFIQEVLDKTFNDRMGFGNTSELEVSRELAGVFSKNTIQWMNDVATIPNRGGIHPFQLVTAVAALDDAAIAQLRASINKMNSPLALFDYATNNKLVRGYTNFWSWANLFPRLGIRSTVDETSMYAITAPSDDVMRFAMGGGRKEGQFLSMATGSKEAIGPIRRAFEKIRGGGPSDYMTLERRKEIIENLRKRLSTDVGYDIPTEEIQHVLIREEIAQRAYDAIFHGVSNEERQYLIDAIKHSPNFLDGAVSSLASRSSLNGKFVEDEFRNPMFTVSEIEKALDDVGKEIGQKTGLTTGRVFSSIPTKDLIKENSKFLTLAHYDNFALRFAYNDVTLIDKKRFTPVNAFFIFNGLKTPSDAERATRMLLKDIGIDYTDTIDNSVKDPVLLESFLSKFGYTTTLRQRGISDVEIARTHIETMLADLRNTFHGGKEAYNQNLMNLVKEKYFDLQEMEKAGKPIYNKWEKAAARVNFQEFEEATQGYQPIGSINTRVKFPGFEPDEEGTITSMISKFGNKTLEAMDHQVNGLFRQKALVITYNRIRKELAPLQEAFKEKQEKLLLAENGFDKKKAAELASELAAKRYTEIAMSDASNLILKYADNQAIRSNFAVSIRTLGRYYRANEDFQRRMFRVIKDKPLQTLYRIRLAHVAIGAQGSIYNDQDGRDYVIFPSDSIINSAVAPTVNFLFNANDTYKIPQFNDVKMRLDLVNPSFSADAGAPTLSSPIAAASVVAIKSLLNMQSFMGRKLPTQPAGSQAASLIEQMVLGRIGKDMTLARAVVPMLASNAYSALSPSDQTREVVSAGIQAISYLQAYGHGIDYTKGKMDDEMYKMLKNVRIAAHNTLVARFIFGMISPSAPILQESKGLPDYYKAIGGMTLRSEFYSILQGIKDAYGPEIKDPYSLATSIFNGKYPGKSIYIAPRTTKEIKVLVQTTNEVKNWAVKHNDFISKHGDAAWVFAPKIGQFNASVYTWMQSQDMINQPKLEDFLKTALVAEDKNTYFQIDRDLETALTGELNLEKRKQLIDQAAVDRQSLLASNPYLKEALLGQNGRPQDEITMDSIREVVADKNSPISSKDRHYMATALTEMDRLVSFANNPDMKQVSNFVQIKQDLRDEIETNINKLALVNPSVKEAYQYVFKPIMNFYSKDTVSVLRKVND